MARSPRYFGPKPSIPIDTLEGEGHTLKNLLTHKSMIPIFTKVQQRGFLVQKSHIPKTREAGQSTIEFILTFAFAIGISFLFVGNSLNMTTGFLMHYATYMSGRTFLTYDLNSTSLASNFNGAERAAKEAFDTYKLSRFGVESSDMKILKPRPVGNNSNIYSGAQARFKKKLTPYKLIGGSQEATFLSEGFLGKEPLRIQCLKMICKAMVGGDCGTNAEMDITVFDNGC